MYTITTCCTLICHTPLVTSTSGPPRPTWCYSHRPEGGVSDETKQNLRLQDAHSDAETVRIFSYSYTTLQPAMVQARTELRTVALESRVRV